MLLYIYIYKYAKSIVFIYILVRFEIYYTVRRGEKKQINTNKFHYCCYRGLNQLESDSRVFVEQNYLLRKNEKKLINIHERTIELFSTRRGRYVYGVKYLNVSCFILWTRVYTKITLRKPMIHNYSNRGEM